MKKPYIAVGVLVLISGYFMFISWLFGFDIQYNRLGPEEIWKRTGDYFTCTNYIEDSFYGGTTPCLFHTAGWDLIPIGTALVSLGLIIYGLLSKPSEKAQLAR